MVRTFLLAGLAAGALLAVAGCGYTPPPGTDIEAETYRKDLDTCRDSAHTTVNRTNAKRALRWFASGVTRWGDISEETQACMERKGWGRVRTCTEAELRDPATPRLVTAEGVRCVVPPARPPARPAVTQPGS